MKYRWLIFLMILITSNLISCNQSTKNNNSKTLKEFEKEVRESIDRRNAQGHRVSRDIVLDTLYLEDIPTRDYKLAFAQYHSSDNKLDLSVLGIENFGTSSIPTYVLVDTRQKKYDIDSVKVKEDSLHVYCRAIVESEQESMRISFDLKFDGKSFPWSVN